MIIKVKPIQENYEKFLELHPPVLSNQLLPDWYKKMKIGNHYDTFLGKNIINAKNCPAIQDIITTGFIIPLWANFYFKTMYDENNNPIMQEWDFTARINENDSVTEFITSHDQKQIKGMDLKTNLNQEVLKIKLPYYFEIPKGYNILYSDPFYHFRQDIRLLSGIVEGDKWGYIQFPFEILKSKFQIKAGTPLIHCLVYKREDEKLILDITNGSKEDYKNVQNDFIELFTTRKNYRTKKEK